GSPLTVELRTGQDPIYHLGDPGWRLLDDVSGPPVIERVEEGAPAAAAGVRRGDKILAIDGRSVQGELEARALLEKSPGRAVGLRSERDGRLQEISVTPRDEDGKGKIGVAFTDGYRVHREFDLRGAFAESFTWARELSGAVFRTLGKFARRQIGPRSFSGPL